MQDRINQISSVFSDVSNQVITHRILYLPVCDAHFFSIKITVIYIYLYYL